MVAVRGKYQNGQVKLEEKVSFTDPVDVIVTFLEEENKPVEKRLTLDDFSFAKSQKALEHYKGSFSDTVIDERRSAL